MVVNEQSRYKNINQYSPLPWGFAPSSRGLQPHGKGDTGCIAVLRYVDPCLDTLTPVWICRVARGVRFHGSAGISWRTGTRHVLALPGSAGIMPAYSDAIQHGSAGVSWGGGTRRVLALPGSAGIMPAYSDAIQHGSASISWGGGTKRVLALPGSAGIMNIKNINRYSPLPWG